jgi:hypothetical protein
VPSPSPINSIVGQGSRVACGRATAGRPSALAAALGDGPEQLPRRALAIVEGCRGHLEVQAGRLTGHARRSSRGRTCQRAARRSATPSFSWVATIRARWLAADTAAAVRSASSSRCAAEKNSSSRTRPPGGRGSARSFSSAHSEAAAAASSHSPCFPENSTVARPELAPAQIATACATYSRMRGLLPIILNAGPDSAGAKDSLESVVEGPRVSVDAVVEGTDLSVAVGADDSVNPERSASMPAKTTRAATPPITSQLMRGGGRIVLFLRFARPGDKCLAGTLQPSPAEKLRQREGHVPRARLTSRHSRPPQRPFGRGCSVSHPLPRSPSGDLPCATLWEARPRASVRAAGFEPARSE